MLDGISLFALVVIACFMVDRTARVITVSLVRIPKAASTEAEANARQRQRVVYLVVAALLSGVVLAHYGKVTIFHALGFNAMPPLLDTVLTAIILTAGADTMGQYLVHGAGARRPVEVIGRLTLENETPPVKLTP
jgi:hypothetical protein